MEKEPIEKLKESVLHSEDYVKKIVEKNNIDLYDFYIKNVISDFTKYGEDETLKKYYITKEDYDNLSGHDYKNYVNDIVEKSNIDLYSLYATKVFNDYTEYGEDETLKKYNISKTDYNNLLGYKLLIDMYEINRENSDYLGYDINIEEAKLHSDCVDKLKQNIAKLSEIDLNNNKLFSDNINKIEKCIYEIRESIDEINNIVNKIELRRFIRYSKQYEKNLVTIFQCL